MIKCSSFISVLIVDEEKDAGSVLKKMISQYLPHLKVLGQTYSVHEAFHAIINQKPDLVFLEIELKDGNGFDLLEKIKNPAFQVIFTTSYYEYALKAFKFNAVDYLLKPLFADLLIEAVKRAENRIHANQELRQFAFKENYRPEKDLGKIVLPSAEGLTVISLRNVVRIEAEACYSTFFTIPQGQSVVSRTIKYFEEILPKDTFFRIHSSHIINIDFVKKFLKEDGGCAMMADGTKIPVARRRKEEFVDLLIEKSLH